MPCRQRQTGNSFEPFVSFVAKDVGREVSWRGHCGKSRRGSVLLVVVGLLMIIGMLGATFLISSHLDAKQSRALARKSPADMLAGGVVDQLCAILLNDLDANSPDGPYGATAAGAAGWKEYIDYPSKDVDDHLMAAWVVKENVPNSAKTWAHVSRIPGGSSKYQLLLGSTDPNAADTDGDRQMKDAWLYDTFVRNGDGDEYWAAVLFYDLSGLICVNTASRYDTGHLTTPTCPVNVNLLDFVLGGDTAAYDTFHEERCDGSTVNTATYNKECAQRLLQPNTSPTNYSPFAIGDEMFLRWGDPNGPTGAGRLFDVFDNLGGIPGKTRMQLTTYNCSRVLVRRPDANDPDFNPVTNDPGKRKFQRRVPLDKINTDDGERQEIYRQMFAMLSKLDLGADEDARKRMAAHFVANLWAYHEPRLLPTRHWEFTPKQADDSNEPFTVYGLRQDLVITEAYAKHNNDPDFDPLTDDSVWGCAIELMNPTGNGVDLQPYRLFRNNAPLTLPGATVPANGGKIVLYNWGKGDDPPAGVNRTAVGLPDPLPRNWEFVGGLNFNDPNLVFTLTRTVLGRIVPIDQISIGVGADLDYDRTAADDEQDSRRDDDLSNARYNVAAYDADSNHALGKPNNADDSEISNDARYPVPIHDGPLNDIGEIDSIYFTGPRYDDGNAKVFSKGLVDANFVDVFPDGPARGRLDFHPRYYSISTKTNVGEVPPGGWSDGNYPDVPAAALLSEFFTLVPPDVTRTDEPAPARIYGRININPATADVLAPLPGPQQVRGFNVDPDMIAKFIITYREPPAQAKQPPLPREYWAGRASTQATGIKNLRTASDSNIAGFLTPGELAIPLADYTNWLLGWRNYASENTSLTKDRGYIRDRDSLYNAVSNLITVNSDTYAANIMVELRDALSGQMRHRWYYIVVIDRSNCYKPDQTPAVLLFSEVK